MSGHLPDFDDRETTVALILLADILTKRGERSPLSRIIVHRSTRPSSKAPVDQSETADPDTAAETE